MRDPYAELAYAPIHHPPVDLTGLEKPVTDLALVSLRKLITDTADAYAAREDQVVVLDDVVADEIAQAVAQRYGIAT